MYICDNTFKTQLCLKYELLFNNNFNIIFLKLVYFKKYVQNYVGTWSQWTTPYHDASLFRIE
jgi:hypothetical protein